MTTSGTSGTTTLEAISIIEHAARRCGVMPSSLGPESITLMKNNLFMLLSTLSNRGINLWRVQRALYGIYPNQNTYAMSSGTLDVLEALYRQPQRLTGTVTSSAGGTAANAYDGDTSTSLTQSSPAGNVSWLFSSSTTVNCVGFLPNGTQTYSLTFEVSDNGSSWTSVKTVSASLTDSVWYWYDIEPAKAGTYFRVRETGTATINAREIYLASTWRETLMWRMNRDDYSALPNKRSTGTPLQFWLDRQRDYPYMVVWQVPTDTFAIFSVFAHMQIEDVGAVSNTLDIPQRWYDAVVSNLAFSSLMELPGADVTRYQNLKDQASIAMTMAEAEERDASPTNWQPNLTAYTS